MEDFEIMYKVLRSEIHGHGVFSTRIIEVGELLGDWTTANKKPKDSDDKKEKYQKYRKLNKGWYETFPLGRICNHSETPNTYCELLENEIVLYAKERIEVNTEIFVDYNWAEELIGYRSGYLDRKK